MPEFDDYARQYKELLHDPIRERFAPQSDFFCERKWLLLREYLDRAGIKTDTAAWLDVGCGRGELLQRGVGTFAEVVGCDVSAGMLQACDGLKVVEQTDPGRLPFDDGKFDLVTSVCVYHHVVPELRAQLTNEIVRVLRPGGTACIIEHNPFNPVTQLIVRRTPVDVDAQLLTAGVARRLLAEGGLLAQQTTYFLYFPEKLYRPLRLLEASLARFPAGGQYASFARKR